MLNQFLASLDPASRLTVRRIAVTLLVAGVLALFAKSGYRLNFFLALTGLAVLVSAVLAMRAQQKFNAPELNYWDETAAYVAVGVLVLPLAND